LKEHGVTKHEFYKTGRALNADQQFSTCGFNAQLVYQPVVLCKKDFDLLKGIHREVARYESMGCISMHTCLNYLEDLGVFKLYDKLKAESFAAGFEESIDMFLPVTSLTTTKTIRNYCPFTSVKLAIYVIRCKKQTDNLPCKIGLTGRTFIHKRKD